MLNIKFAYIIMMSFLFIENSRSDFVQFQAASTIREASMREWSILPLEEKTALRGYLVQFLTAHPRLINYVRSQLLHTVAVMVKRATLDEDQKKLFDSVLSTISQLLATDDHKMVREMEGEREWGGGGGENNIIKYHTNLLSRCSVILVAPY